VVPRKGPVITIGGLHGVGKSTHGKRLAEVFELRYVSTGMMFRDLAKEKGMSLAELSELSTRDPAIDLMIDNMTKTILADGNVVFDSLLASYFARDYESLRIYLQAPTEVRLLRIANRDGKRAKESKKETFFREGVELERFKRYYGIDMSDISIFHLVLDTSILPVDLNLKILIETIGCYLEERWSRNVRNDCRKDMCKK
jgi:cytidylate kinase